MWASGRLPYNVASWCSAQFFCWCARAARYCAHIFKSQSSFPKIFWGGSFDGGDGGRRLMTSVMCWCSYALKLTSRTTTPHQKDSAIETTRSDLGKGLRLGGC